MAAPMELLRDQLEQITKRMKEMGDVLAFKAIERLPGRPRKEIR